MAFQGVHAKTCRSVRQGGGTSRSCGCGADNLVRGRDQDIEARGSKESEQNVLDSILARVRKLLDLIAEVCEETLAEIADHVRAFSELVANQGEREAHDVAI